MRYTVLNTSYGAECIIECFMHYMVQKVLYGAKCFICWLNVFYTVHYTYIPVCQALNVLAFGDKLAGLENVRHM